MKVALVAQTYGPANGPGAFTMALARGLAARGDDVLVIAPAAPAAPGPDADGAVARAAVRAVSLAPLYPEVHLALAPGRAVRRALDAFAPDLVHVQDHFPLGRAGARAAAMRGLPLVATNHFVPENIAPHVPLPRALVHRVLWRMVARAFAPAAIVTTPTETAAARLRPHLAGVPLVAISCGVELARFAPGPAFDRAAERRALGFAAADRVIAYVGRLDVEKRVEVLVRAVALVRRPDIKLLVVGRGQRGAALRRLARALGAADRVVFAGFQPPARVAELLACADCFAMPGDVELQSIATLEAMAAGLPVLAANAGALPELVADDTNGALFAPNDPAAAAARLGELVDAAARWPAMGDESRRRAARHELAHTIDAYRTLYADVTAAFARRSRRR